jgi:hypothetical protein
MECTKYKHPAVFDFLNLKKAKTKEKQYKIKIMFNFFFEKK